MLRSVDIILAEDTRVTGLLCHQHAIDTPLESFHEHNMRKRIPRILERLKQGRSFALVTDRGMPAVSDPGQELVDQVWQEGLSVSVVPGPSAVVTAYAASGFPHPFVFWGFLPRITKARRETLFALKESPYTGVLYVAPHHLRETLFELTRYLEPTRMVLLARELTKRYEELWRGPLQELVAVERDWRGEIVLVLGPATSDEPPRSLDWDELVKQVREREAEGERQKEAIRVIASKYGVAKRELYQRVQKSQGDF